jgi:hypothetical protein
MHIVHRRGDVLGPATTWMLEALLDLAGTMQA